MKTYLWTQDGARLHYQSAYKNSDINWLFLPGGPGLGSEALQDLTAILANKIPGVIWRLDLPNDGSNVLEDKPISNWRSALLQAIFSFEKVVLVAHSTLGMYVQTMPELEGVLHGLVLISSAPDASWQKNFYHFYENNKNALIIYAEQEYAKKPSDENLRALLLATAEHCFSTRESVAKGMKLIQSLPINYLASEWSAKNFDSDYKATWIPKVVPTLIITGADDQITPLKLFSNKACYFSQNFILKEIPAAGHYPWFENPQGVIEAFKAFCLILYTLRT